MVVSTLEEPVQKNRLLFLFGIIIVVLAVFLGLISGGVIQTNNTTSTSATHHNLAVKQLWEPREEKENIASHFVRNTVGDLIAWVSNGFVHFAAIENNLISKESSLAIDNSSEINSIAISNNKLAISYKNTISIFDITETSVLLHGTSPQGLLSIPEEGKALCYTTNGDLIVSVNDGLRIYRDQLLIISINIESATESFGNLIVCEKNQIFVADPGANNNLGKLYIFGIDGKSQQTIENETSRVNFGQNFCVNNRGDFLFVNYEEVVEVFLKKDKFQHVQTIMNTLLTSSVRFNYFGAALSAYGNYLVVGSPSGLDDNFSSIQLYQWEKDRMKNIQQISMDVGLFGSTVWVMSDSPLRLLVTNEKGSSFGQLIMLA